MSTVRIAWRDGGATPTPAPGTPAARAVSVVLHAAALAVVLQGTGVTRTIVEQFDEPPLVVRLAAPVSDVPSAPEPAPRPASPPVRTPPDPVQAAASAPPPNDQPPPSPLPVLAAGDLAPVGTRLVADAPPPIGNAGGRDRAQAPVPRSAEGVGDGPATAPVVAPLFDAAYLNNPRPPYPEAAVRRGVTGVVMLRVLVGAHGRAESVELEQSSGSRLLDESALVTVRNAWRFVPARRDGVAVAATVIVPVRFELAPR